jgi:predicted flap endonuclease-1-like 5' DNA nuclease
MGSPDLQDILLLASVALMGGLVGWLSCARAARSKRTELNEDWQNRYDDVRREVAHQKTHAKVLETAIANEHEVVQQHKHAAIKSQTELESLRQKAGTLAKNLLTLGAERDHLRNKLKASQKLLGSVYQQVRDLKSEFQKSKDFYTAQMKSALEQRQQLENKVTDAREEQKSLNFLLTASRDEYESVNRQLALSQARLEGLEKLENKVVALEADNAELRHRATVASREVVALQHDVDELRELKSQNKELTNCLQSMETSRKQYEEDAKRYRVQYEEAEKLSDTLRMQLGNIEENFRELQGARDDSRIAAESNGSTPLFGLSEPEGEADDLTEIVGIGKVFEEMLHDLGIYHFRQIAAFGADDIAHINSALKEFKGRIEHDDWVGQARELHDKKYGGAG